ncbi:unnamed protein product [Wuchereria bancrofti]|uniref:Uncharacterized protein n=2 Tax=Wuchereria bancrofti TaxID=6293 RepID=A0A3P7DZE6_WUCBA|nr:unnamed protein product [Wuchereria bancrofti]
MTRKFVKRSKFFKDFGEQRSTRQGRIYNISGHSQHYYHTKTEVDDGQMKGQDKIAVATAQIMMKEGDSQFSSSSTVVVSDTYPISILM